MSGGVLAEIGGLVMVAGLTGLARPAAAAPAPTLKIVLDVRDHARIPTHIVTRAKAEMTRIYRDACVNIIWSDPAPGTEQLLSRSPLQLDLSFRRRRGGSAEVFMSGSRATPRIGQYMPELNSKFLPFDHRTRFQFQCRAV